MAAFAAFVAVSAYGGAIGFWTGAIDMGATLDQRLPLHSPVLAGIALALIVGVPTTVVAVLAWRGDPRVGRATVAAGLALIAWIVIEIAFIRELAFLQLFYAGAGAAFVAIGRRPSR